MAMVAWTGEQRMEPTDRQHTPLLTKTDLITIGIVAVCISALTLLLLLLLF